MPLQNPVELTAGVAKAAVTNNVPCDSADIEANVKDNTSGEHVLIFFGDATAPLATLKADGGLVHLTGLSNLTQLQIQSTAAGQKLTVRPYLS